MNSVVFDSGPMISLTTNNLLWLLKPLKERFGGKFYIPAAVKYELVDRPLMTKKFKFEAVQVMNEVREKNIEIVENAEIKDLTMKLLDLANNSFSGHGNFIRLVQYAEMEVLASAIIMGANAVVIDERTTKLFVENPPALMRMLEKRLGTKIIKDDLKLREFMKLTDGIKIIRSFELVTVAYEIGLLEKFTGKLDGIINTRRELLDGVLWGLKLHGCSVSEDEINNVIDMELKK
jgi:hypothetical protein